MSATLTLLKDVAKTRDVYEELGTLADVPEGWLKLLTRQGAGDQSEIVPIKKNLRSTRDMGSTIKELANRGEFAGLYLVKSDGAPIGIIRYTGEGGKPWQFITPEGKAHTQTDRVNRAVPAWKRRRVTTTDPGGRSRTWTPSGQRETVSVERRDVSLNELSSLIPFADGVDLFGIKQDAARAAKHQQRQAARAGQDTDIKQLKQGAAQKFVAGKVGTSLDDLKAQIQSVTDEVRQNLDTAISAASAGEYGRGVSVLSQQKMQELNAMLSDLASLSRRVKEVPVKGVKSHYKRGTHTRDDGGTWRSYEFDDLMSDLERIKARLAKVGTGGRYENQARELVSTVLKQHRKNE